MWKTVTTNKNKNCLLRKNSYRGEPLCRKTMFFVDAMGKLNNTHGIRCEIHLYKLILREDLKTTKTIQIFSFQPELDDNTRLLEIAHTMNV